MDISYRMKTYESKETSRKLIPCLPIYIRLDGRSFSYLCKDMEKPYDVRMHRIMSRVTESLVSGIHCCIGYTQSDEINLVLKGFENNYNALFGNRIFKLTSTIAGTASSVFLLAYLDEFGKEDYPSIIPSFDCRVINLPNKTEVANMILWRNMDASRCALNLAAQSVYTQKELHGRNKKEIHEMLKIKGINFDDYPEHFKRGVFFVKSEQRDYIPDSIYYSIPKNKRPESRIVTRRKVEQKPMPIFSKVTNREGVIFENADPITES